jgi:hypothetical protein
MTRLIFNPIQTASPYCGREGSILVMTLEKISDSKLEFQIENLTLNRQSLAIGYSRLKSDISILSAGGAKSE